MITCNSDRSSGCTPSRRSMDTLFSSSERAVLTRVQCGIWGSALTWRTASVGQATYIRYFLFRGYVISWCLIYLHLSSFISSPFLLTSHSHLKGAFAPLFYSRATEIPSPFITYLSAVLSLLSKNINLQLCVLEIGMCLSFRLLMPLPSKSLPRNSAIYLIQVCNQSCYCRFHYSDVYRSCIPL